MTPDDRRRLAEISPLRGDYAGFLRRLLYEATAERDAAVADGSMASGALHAIHGLLDSGGIPRGTFADDHVRNLVALYNQRGDALDAAMAALRELAADLHMLRVAINSVEGYRDLLVRVDDMQRLVKRELAAHSAATKPEEPK